MSVLFDMIHVAWSHDKRKWHPHEHPICLVRNVEAVEVNRRAFAHEIRMNASVCGVRVTAHHTNLTNSWQLNGEKFSTNFICIMNE